MKEFIVFSNNNQNFAMEISNVNRIIEYDTPIGIPESSKFLLGVIKYRGSILPIIDLTMKLYNKSITYDLDSKIIIIQWKGKQVGLLVEDILGIYKFEDNQYEDSNIDTEVSQEYIKGFIKVEEDITIELKPDKLFIYQQEKELISATSYEY